MGQNGLGQSKPSPQHMLAVFGQAKTLKGPAFPMPPGGPGPGLVETNSYFPCSVIDPIPVLDPDKVAMKMNELY